MGGPLLRRIALTVGALIVLAGGAVVLSLWAIRADLQRAESNLERISLETASAGDGIEALATPVLDPIHRADQRANGAILGAVAGFPVLGDQVEGLRALTGRLDALADVAEDQLDLLDAAFEAASTPEGTVALADTLLEALVTLEDAVATSPPVESGKLVGPLHDASVDLDDALDEASVELAELRGHVSTGRDVLVGPTNILVLAANNAEQRAGMGMPLSAGIVTIDRGEFTTSDFVATETLTDHTEGRADYPDELQPIFEEIWDYGREWRTVASTPNFPVVGSVFEELADIVGLGDVDAVISVDGIALEGLLQATGPIEVEGQDVRSDNVVDLLLRDNYLTFAGSGELNRERRELQGEIASTIFSALTDREVDPLELAAELADSAEGRHLLAWSDDRDLQTLWESLGADGDLASDSLMISVQNATGSKRDYYLDPTMSIQALGDHRYRATATLPNPVVSPTAEVVEGTNPLVPPGFHRAYVTFTLPGAASDVDVVGGRLSRQGTDGPTDLVAVWLRVPVGGTGTAGIEFDLPASLRVVEILPSARIRPVTYTVGAHDVVDDVATPVILPLGPIQEHEPKIPQALGLSLAFAGMLLLVTRSRRLAGPDPDLAAARVDLAIGVAFLVVGIGALLFI